MYAFVNRTPGRADTVICVDNEQAALDILKSKKIDILTAEEAYDI